jgi:hypothetical protein
MKHLLLRSGDIELNPGPGTNTADLCVIYLNARSFLKHKDLIEAEVEHVDIVTISETWFSPSHDVNDICLTGFHPPIRRDRPDDPHGGVAIYVRNNLYCKPRPDLQVQDLEAVWVETKLNQESLLIGSFYRPPNSRVNYWEYVNDSIRKANYTELKFIILGDFNTDWLDNPSQHLLDIIDLHQLHQIINEPTRVTDTTSSCLDLIMVQNPQIVKRSEVLPEICSDHRIACAHIRNTVIKNKPFKRTIYNYNKLDINKFCTLLSDVNWDNLVENGAIDDVVNNFTDLVMDLAKQCMPVKTVLIRPKDAQWINDEVRLLIKERKQIHCVAKRTNLKDDWDRFRRVRNYVTTKN